MAFHSPSSRRLMSTSTAGRCGDGPITRIMRRPRWRSVSSASPIRASSAGLAQVHDPLDRRQLAQHQLGRGLPERHREHARVAQELVLERAADAVGTGGLERERGEMGGRDALVEIDLAKARDRGDVDQHLAEQHEADRQHQQTRGQRAQRRRQMAVAGHSRAYSGQSARATGARSWGSPRGRRSAPVRARRRRAASRRSRR